MRMECRLFQYVACYRNCMDSKQLSSLRVKYISFEPLPALLSPLRITKVESSVARTKGALGQRTVSTLAPINSKLYFVENCPAWTRFYFHFWVVGYFSWLSTIKVVKMKINGQKMNHNFINPFHGGPFSDSTLDEARLNDFLPQHRDKLAH